MKVYLWTAALNFTEQIPGIPKFTTVHVLKEIKWGGKKTSSTALFV